MWDKRTEMSLEILLERVHMAGIQNLFSYEHTLRLGKRRALHSL
jgi:hypothetical protein